MDFTLGEELEAVGDLARRIFTDRASQERIRAAEESPAGFDEGLWGELAETGLLGVALPEDADGAGLGAAGLAVLLEEQGRTVAPVPIWPAVVAALTIAEHGTPARRGILPSALDGSARLTVALEEFGTADPAAPRCTAVRDGDGWLLTGTKAVVPAPSGTSHVLVSASALDGPGLFLVETSAAGTSWERAETTTRDKAAHLTLDGAPAQALGGEALAAALRLARVSLAAVQIGVAEGALRLAADHLAAREQFGRPLAAFQAVQHQLADCYIEIEALRV